VSRATGGLIFDHIRRQDMEAFRDAARTFRVHILVRRTNPGSLQYIGRRGYIPKPIDCKPKTADRNVMLPTGIIARCGGLVVNPMLPGFEQAFVSERKAKKAIAEWLEFAQKYGLLKDLYSGEAYVAGKSEFESGGKSYQTTDRGGVFLVQYDPAHQHYGCVMFCPLKVFNGGAPNLAAAIQPLTTRPTNLFIHGDYDLFIHGDYDLFGIVPVDMPGFKSVHQAILFGLENTYSEETRQVTEFLNRRMGTPMIQHGAQENAPIETDEYERLDVFWAGGQISEVRGRDTIEKLYAETFAGRKVGPQSSGLIP